MIEKFVNAVIRSLVSPRISKQVGLDQLTRKVAFQRLNILRSKDIGFSLSTASSVTQGNCGSWCSVEAEFGGAVRAFRLK